MIFEERNPCPDMSYKELYTNLKKDLIKIIEDNSDLICELESLKTSIKNISSNSNYFEALFEEERAKNRGLTEHLDYIKILYESESSNNRALRDEMDLLVEKFEENKLEKISERSKNFDPRAWSHNALDEMKQDMNFEEKYRECLGQNIENTRDIIIFRKKIECILEDLFDSFGLLIHKKTGI